MVAVVAQLSGYMAILRGIGANKILAYQHNRDNQLALFMLSFWLCGDVKTGIYLASSHKLLKSVRDNYMDVMQLHRCIKQGDISEAQIVKSPKEVSKSTSLEKSGDYFESLCVRVDFQVIRMQISKSKW